MSVFLTRILSALVGNGAGPREQIIQEACVRIVHVLGNLREQVLEIFIRLQTICLRCLHDAVDRGAGLGAVNGVKDTPIVAAYAERSDCSLTGGVIYVSHSTCFDSRCLTSFWSCCIALIELGTDATKRGTIHKVVDGRSVAINPVFRTNGRFQLTVFIKKYLCVSHIN